MKWIGVRVVEWSKEDDERLETISISVVHVVRIRTTGHVLAGSTLLSACPMAPGPGPHSLPKDAVDGSQVANHIPT
jgi:hypothetical protein